ncbi:MAG: hypothetical protein K6E62_12160 [Lachnospiraceae bacterium]|nr:hypothetical protein [Lachnospiraceae bacterium]
MICIFDKDDFRFSNTAVTIGKFDALHIGHKALIGRMAEYKKAGLKTVVLRLDIPSDGYPGYSGDYCNAGNCGYLRYSDNSEGSGNLGNSGDSGNLGNSGDSGNLGDSWQQIRTESERIGILERLGTDIYIRLAFTEKLARMSAEDFIKDYLVGKLDVRKLIVGEDFRFGHERRGNIEMLTDAGRKYGFETTEVAKIRMNGEAVSSSNIRRLLKNGETEKVRELLGDDRDLRNADQISAFLKE